jgi:hypothetical protein
LRQQRLALQRLENQVRADVQNALIGLTRARALYQSTTKARMLQAQTLGADAWLRRLAQTLAQMLGADATGSAAPSGPPP